MSSAPRVLSDRARAIIEAAEASARTGTARPGRLPEGLPITAPRRRMPSQPLLRAVEPSPRRAHRVAPDEPAVAGIDPTAVAAIPDPERLLPLIQRIALQASEIRRRLDALSEAVGRVEADVLRPEAPAAAPADVPATDAAPAADTAPLGDEPATVAPPEPVGTPAPMAPAPPAGPAAPEPIAATLPPAAPAPAPSAPSDTARLVAIEMAVGGASRAEARTRLTDEFGIRDVDSLLDDVFGPGSSGSSRMRWA